MLKQTNLHRIGLFILMTIALLFIADTQASAQKKDYKPGEKIEYLAATYPEEVWEEGVFVGKTYDGSQPIIRQKPDQWNKQGFQTASSWEKIRPLGSGAIKTAPANTDENEKPDNKTTTVAASKNDGKGLMTKAEIIEYLKTRIGTDGPHPKKTEVSKELVEMIKRRGVDFRLPYTELHQISQVGGNDTTYDIKSAIEYNYGAPTPQSWLMGTWNMTIVAIGRYGSVGGKAAFLTINKDKTYTWKPGLNDPIIKGSWREATEKEMKLQGGAGIVLLKGESGDDWLVRKAVNPNFKTDHIDVWHLQYGGAQRRIGQRK
ncbi:MAG: hypothetical protein M3384_05270 [Acidobacteriota bacterium]|nr:hypothetical protein [Acidobacteriota bacterium]